MTVEHRHPVGLDAGGQVSLDPAAIVHGTEQQARLLLDLFLLAANIGYDVAQDIQRRNSGVASS